MLLFVSVCGLFICAFASASVTNTHFFSAKSPWNTPIAAGAKIDPNSSSMIAGLSQAGKKKGFPVSHHIWTTSLWYSSKTTRKVNVIIDSPWRSDTLTLYGVPIPSNAKPDPSADGHMSVVDRAGGCEWDFWQVRKTARGWVASSGNGLPLFGNGIYPRGAAADASGFSLLAGLIRPEEIQTGSIDHALFFAYPFTRSGGPVFPATSSDGRTPGKQAIPEGARVQLEPSLNLDTFNLMPWQVIIAKALQKYGMILGDTGGAVGLSAAGDNSTTYLYPWASKGSDYGYLPPDLLSHMRVLSLPPQMPNRAQAIVPNRCAKFSSNAYR